jgi:hypothetical protein
MTEIVPTVSWIEETVSAVRLARDVGEAQQKVDLLTDANTHLERSITQFKQLQVSSKILQGKGWEGKSPNPDLFRNLEKAIRSLDSRSLQNARDDLSEFEREVTTSLKGHWNLYVDQRLGNVKDLLILSETLSGVTGVNEISQELLAILRKLATSRDSIPSNDLSLLLSQAENLLQKLESALKPDSVRRFLSAVARGGASVHTLNSEITKWLDDHRSLNRFRIVAGEPVEDSDA